MAYSVAALPRWVICVHPCPMNIFEF